LPYPWCALLPAWQRDSSIAHWYDRNAEGENDHYTQPGNPFRLIIEQDKKNTISNIVGSMQRIVTEKKAETINRQLCHFFRADVNLGMEIVKGLSVNVDQFMPKNSYPGTALISSIKTIVVEI
jgi:catalase